MKGYWPGILLYLPTCHNSYFLAWLIFQSNWNTLVSKIFRNYLFICILVQNLIYCKMTFLNPPSFITVKSYFYIKPPSIRYIFWNTFLSLSCKFSLLLPCILCSRTTWDSISLLNTLLIEYIAQHLHKYIFKNIF